MALLAEYDFNENTGTTTADLTGNGYDLTTDGSGWVSGGYESSYSGKQFSGAMGPNVLQQSWTVMAWVNWQGGGSYYQAIVSNGTSFFLELHHFGDQIECYAGTYGHPNTYFATPTNTWFHVAATRNADGSSVLYVNGQPIASGVGNAMNFGSGTWSAAASTGNPTYNLSGSVDALRIFDEALSAEQVRAWLHTPYGCKPPILLAAYAFNEADGATTITDYSGNGVTASASGASFTDGPLARTRAVTFTGTGQSVQVPRAGTEPATVGVTAMLWAKGPVDINYLTKPKALGGSTRMGIGPDWRARWKEDLHFTDGGSGVDTSTWHHYCVVDADDEWVVLIDGTYYTGGGRSFTNATPAAWEDFPWIIGDTGGASLGNSQNGQTVAEVRIFQGAMYSEPQVQYYMNTPVAPQGRKFRLNGLARPVKLGATEKFLGA